MKEKKEIQRSTSISCSLLPDLCRRRDTSCSSAHEFCPSAPAIINYIFLSCEPKQILPLIKKKYVSPNNVGYVEKVLPY